MEDWTKRFSVAALCGFFAFVVGLPVSCGGMLIYSEYRFGDVERGGPAALMGGLIGGAVMALVVFVVVWRKAGTR